MKLRINSKSSAVDAWTLAQLGSFYTKHRSELLAHANRIMKDTLRAEEIVQEALIRIMLAAPELSSEQHALGYVHRTIENLCIDVFRMEGRRPHLIALDDEKEGMERTSQSFGDLSDIVSAADDAVIVRQALSMLSPAERAALIMWEMEGRSTKEIARELGVKESSVRHTVSRARSSLRRILSEIVFDESRGLTALEMLSITYRKSAELAKKSSKTALSIFLFFFAVLGFTSMPIIPQNSNLTVGNFEPSPLDIAEVAATNSSLTTSSIPEIPASAATSMSDKKVPDSKKKTKLEIPGLNAKGLPDGFTVSDSSGDLGLAYFRERDSLQTESALFSRQIFKTEKGAANIFISQSLTIGGDRPRYEPVVSFGRDGRWVPLSVKVLSTEFERQKSGDYLLTVAIRVDSVVESPIEILASAGGRDLSVAPRLVVTRLLLDSSKTRVIAQTVYVDNDGTSA